MKKDRIQIDGVWYVKEEPTQNKIEIEDHQLTQCQTIVYGTDDYCWEASRIYNDDGVTFIVYGTDDYCWEASRIYNDDGVTFYDGVDITFTDKKGNRKEWKKDYWDNDNWFRGVYENDEDSLEAARESMNENGIAHFQAFIGKLIEKGWL